MPNIKGLNIRAMLSLLAMDDNNFVIGNAALDLNKNAGCISQEMKRIESVFDFDFFTRKDCERRTITGLTDKGAKFTESVRSFIGSIDGEMTCYTKE